MANILAVQLSSPQDTGTGVIESGYSIVLAVSFATMGENSFRFYGDNLYMLYHDIGSMDTIQLFRNFLREFYEKPMRWAELVEPPRSLRVAVSRIFYGVLPEPQPPVGEATMVIIDSGYDPLKGWWVEFAGRIIPIFTSVPVES